MEFLKQALLDFLKRKSSIDLKEIKRELKISSESEVLLLKRCLECLEEDAKIYKDNKGKYSLLSSKKNIMQGTVSFLANGDVNVVTNDGKRIIIAKENANGLLEKDIITVKNLYLDKKIFFME